MFAYIFVYELYTITWKFILRLFYGNHILSIIYICLIWYLLESTLKEDLVVYHPRLNDWLVTCPPSLSCNWQGSSVSPCVKLRHPASPWDPDLTLSTSLQDIDLAPYQSCTLICYIYSISLYIPCQPILIPVYSIFSLSECHLADISPGSIGRGCLLCFYLHLSGQLVYLRWGD